MYTNTKQTQNVQTDTATMTIWVEMCKLQIEIKPTSSHAVMAIPPPPPNDSKAAQSHRLRAHM